MRYRLVVTTDGRPGLLERTLDSFFTKVRPLPAELAVVDDSGDPHYRRFLDATLLDYGQTLRIRTNLVSHPSRLGFCETVADGWALASRKGVEWVYWLEDDFVHHRGVDLLDLAYVLERQPQVAQMSLARDPANEAERAAGGFIALNPADYSRRGSGTVAWLETRRNWTTNPSLFPRLIAADYRWPTEQFCEGLFGFQIREQRPETTFGIWGVGEPWVTHIGELRVGAGY